MKMPQTEHLIQAARTLGEDARVPYAFEKRVMARLEGSAVLDFAGAWVRLMWQAAACCIAISIMAGAYASFVNESAPAELLAIELEQTVLAPIQMDESW